MIAFAAVYIIAFIIIISIGVSIRKASKKRARASSGATRSREYEEASRQLRSRNTSQPGRVSAASARRNEQLSNSNAKKAQRQLEMGGLFSKNSRNGFDDYSVLSASASRAGYDRTYREDSRTRQKTYSHT